jgi:hypothetical protein
MPTLADSKIEFVKALLMGDSGAGKTGALVSLVAAGYKIRILDLDNKVATGILPKAIMRTCPDKIGNVDYISMRDKKKASGLGPIFDGVPQTFSKCMEYLDKWSDGTVPRTWGADTVFVLDSLTFLGDAAFNWAKAMNSSVKDPRQWFYTAQQAVEDVIAMLTAETFKTNVLVIAHVSWSQKKDATGVELTKGYPASIGKALDNTIPAYFDSMILAQASATLPVKRTIQTAQTSMVDLKNPASFSMLPTLPLETGLATFFEEMRK